MAKPDTEHWEHATFLSGSDCNKCGSKDVKHRKFYSPTFMNGDDECLISLCDECYKKK
jgi:hypothetical protein